MVSASSWVECDEKIMMNAIECYRIHILSKCEDVSCYDNARGFSLSPPELSQMEHHFQRRQRVTSFDTSIYIYIVFTLIYNTVLSSTHRTAAIHLQTQIMIVKERTTATQNIVIRRLK